MQKIGNQDLPKVTFDPHHCEFETGRWDYQLTKYPERAFLLLYLDESRIKRLHLIELEIRRPIFTFEMTTWDNNFYPKEAWFLEKQDDKFNEKRKNDIVAFFKTQIFKFKPSLFEMECQHPWSPAVGSILYLHQWDWNLFNDQAIRHELVKVDSRPKEEKTRIRENVISSRDDLEGVVL